MGELLVTFQSVRRWQRDPDSTHTLIKLRRPILCSEVPCEVGHALGLFPSCRADSDSRPEALRCARSGPSENTGGSIARPAGTNAKPHRRGKAVRFATNGKMSVVVHSQLMTAASCTVEFAFDYVRDNQGLGL